MYKAVARKLKTSVKKHCWSPPPNAHTACVYTWRQTGINFFPDEKGATSVLCQKPVITGILKAIATSLPASSFPSFLSSFPPPSFQYLFSSVGQSSRSFLTTQVSAPAHSWLWVSMNTEGWLHYTILFERSGHPWMGSMGVRELVLLGPQLKDSCVDILHCSPNPPLPWPAPPAPCLGFSIRRQLSKGSSHLHHPVRLTVFITSRESSLLSFLSREGLRGLRKWLQDC